MEISQAYALLHQVCANFQGNLQDHLNLQAALKAVREALGIPEGGPQMVAPVPVEANGEASPNRQQRRAASKSG